MALAAVIIVQIVRMLRDRGKGPFRPPGKSSSAKGKVRGLYKRNNFSVNFGIRMCVCVTAYVCACLPACTRAHVNSTCPLL